MKGTVVYVLEVYQENKTLRTEWHLEDHKSERIIMQLASRVARNYEKQGYEYCIFRKTIQPVKFNIKKERLEQV